MELREWRKSTIMDRWIGEKLPYQMRLTVVLPLRSGPLWYLSTRGCSLTRAASLLVVANAGSSRDKSTRSEVKMVKLEIEAMENINYELKSEAKERLLRVLLCVFWEVECFELKRDVV